MTDELVKIITLVEKIGFPIVVFFVVCLLLWKLWPSITGCFTAYQDAKKARAEADNQRAQAEFERNEIARQQIEALNQSTAVVKNCTTVIERTSGDNKLLREALFSHEQASRERDLRTESKQDDILKRIGSVQGTCGKIEVLANSTHAKL